MKDSHKRSLLLSAALAAGLALAASAAHAGGAYTATALVTDTTDPSLVNAWGVSYAPGGPFWISDNGTGLSTLYTGTGAKVPLTVAIYPGAGTSTPTGQVFNAAGAGFQVSSGGKTGSSVFIFDNEDGAISGWAPSVTTSQSFLGYNGTANGAIYKGLAFGNDGTEDVLYAANFGQGEVDMIDGSWTNIGHFTDPSLAAKGYSPFNTQVLNGKLFVTFAKSTGGVDEVDGAGLGYVDEFNLDGSFDKRIASAGGPLNAPWGLAIAPASFGSRLGGDLLVGNFGDGTITAFNLTTGHSNGPLQTTGGAPLSIDGLWALIPGNGGMGGSTDNIYFTAGPNNESGGEFGVLTHLAVPEPATWASMLLGLGLLGAVMRRGRSRLTPA